MKRTSYKFLMPLLLGSFIFLSACGGDKKGAPKGGPGGAPQMPQLPVVTVPVKTVTSYTTYPTSMEGIVNSAVYAKISGYITEVLVDEGQQVHKGQALFKLETQSLNQDAAAAKANVNAAQVEVDKLRPLVDKKIISNVQLETANAKLQQAKSGYNSIAANIGYGTIKSPVDGYIGAINLRKGALVSSATQEPLTTVADISSIYAYFSMNESEYIDFIKNAEGTTMAEKIKGLPKVRLILANGDLFLEEGRIETINSQVNQNTGSISFRAIFDNKARLLTSGSSGKIQVPKTYTDAVVVPVPSTYEQQGDTYVYTIGEDSTAISTRLKITDEVGNLYVIAEGLKEGDKIVAEGADKLKGKTKIKPFTVPFDSIAKPTLQTFR